MQPTSAKKRRNEACQRVCGLHSRRPTAQVVLKFRATAALARALPEPLARWLGRNGGGIAFRIARERRATVAGHQRRILRHVLGREPDAAAVAAATNGVFRNLGRAWIDTARAHRSSRGEVEETMRVEGWPHVAAALNEGRPVIMAMAHIGAWDRGGVWLSRRIPLTVVAERLEPPEVFDWFVRERTAAGMRVIGLDQHTGATLLAELRSGRSIGLLCDRDLTGDGVPVSFFGAPTTLPGGPAVLALRTGAVILPCAVYLTEGPMCVAVIRPPVTAERTSTGAGSLRRDVERVTAAVARELEHLIAAAPDQWLVLQPHWS